MRFARGKTKTGVRPAIFAISNLIVRVAVRASGAATIENRKNHRPDPDLYFLLEPTWNHNKLASPCLGGGR